MKKLKTKDRIIIILCGAAFIAGGFAVSADTFIRQGNWQTTTAIVKSYRRSANGDSGTYVATYEVKGRMYQAVFKGNGPFDNRDAKTVIVRFNPNNPNSATNGTSLHRFFSAVLTLLFIAGGGLLVGYAVKNGEPRA